MKKYFMNQLAALQEVSDITQEDIASFREMVILELDKMGASENEKNLLHDATIYNAIKRNRLPEDVAWAVLQ
ncbi:MAG: hypothetical protein NC302_04115 [Bacteroidales bacterium]|nr:hypothetical protein [Bacteroidales bacterium]MCM1414803.1 hypothetical protein [bacterium]MCM1422434.1 hypothetical protein [bacterium]